MQGYLIHAMTSTVGVSFFERVLFAEGIVYVNV
jgi:hypothetical protein